MAEVDINTLPNDPLPVPGDNLEGQKAAGGVGSSKSWKLEHVKGHQVYKPADQAKAEDIVLGDDSVLKFPMLANEIWQFEIMVFIHAAIAPPDIKLALNGPAGLGDLRAWIGSVNPNFGAFAFGDVVTAYEQTVEPNYGIAPDDIFALVKGTVKNGVNAGDLVLRWAQRISNASPTTVRQGSYLLANKLG